MKKYFSAESSVVEDAGNIHVEYLIDGTADRMFLPEDVDRLSEDPNLAMVQSELVEYLEYKMKSILSKTEWTIVSMKFGIGNYGKPMPMTEISMKLGIEYQSLRKEVANIIKTLQEELIID